ncbi:MAG: XRE family transcriptional regulator [Thermosynechococcaceae cyanobacterium MS004]|nr:XRE family transcriptional regulator [Thermosynechococcaceae cyanobacterium MS004]
MTFDLSLFSSKLRKYREQLKTSLDEVSAATGISTQALATLENAKRRPTGDEVLILADYYQCDYQFFISNEKLAPFEQTETLYRRHGNEFSKEDRWTIQEFLFLCECEEFLLNAPPRRDYKPFRFSKVGDYFKGHGEQAATKLREHFGYSSIQVGSDIYDDFRRLGFHIFRRQLGNSNISGLYIKHPTAGKCILVNYSEDVYRQRFTAAHESAHAILDEEEDFIVSFVWDKSNLVEIRANTFASRYLMPPDFLRNIPDSSNWTTDKAIDWANRLKVSTEALANALKNANLISQSTAIQIKAVKVPSDRKIDPELPASLSPATRLRREQSLKRGLSTFYVNLCFEAYEQDFISAGRLAEMLLVSERELNEMADLYGRVLMYGN